MKPEISRVPTERAHLPFEIITMDFAEFTKGGDSFICLGDKFSGARHVEGVSKGGNQQRQ